MTNRPRPPRPLGMALLMQELIPKYFDPAEVTIVTGGVAETTALLAEK